MNVREIIKDALKYPLSDWKKILILGIIVIISGLGGTALSVGTKNMDVISLLVGIGFIIGFLVNGYVFKIIKSSLNGAVKLPEFNDWIDLGAEGAKVFIVYIVYLIPVILLIIYLIFSSYENLALMLKEVGLNLFTYSLIPSLNSVILEGILNFIMLLISLFTIIGVLANFIGILYIILVTPIMLVAIANMAYYEGEFKSAFKLREIIEEISIIGWLNLIKWYILTGIIFLIIELTLLFISYISFAINLDSIADILLWKLLALTLIPYSYIFMARSVALFYMPDKEED